MFKVKFIITWIFLIQFTYLFTQFCIYIIRCLGDIFIFSTLWVNFIQKVTVLAINIAHYVSEHRGKIYF